MAILSPEKTQALHDEVLAALKDKFPEGVVSSSCEYDFPVFVVEKEVIHDVIKYLKETPALNYHFLTTMCALHYPENSANAGPNAGGGREFAMMYQLHNMPENKRIRIKTFLPEQKLEIPTLTDLWATANWMERQEYDFFGVNFIGHPNLTRILNMEDITFFPMRKEFPMEDQTRDDKNDTMFGR